MKASWRGWLLCSAATAALSLAPLAVSYAQSDPGEIDLDAEKVEIVHGPGTGNDVANLKITFTNTVEGCDDGADDAIASGVEVSLSPFSCESFTCDASAPSALCTGAPIITVPFDYIIDPFVEFTINETEYGTFFGLNPPDTGPGTVLAQIVAIPTYTWVCGTWKLNVEATGLDLSSITANPLSLTLNDSDGSGPFCFDIHDAIIGGKIQPIPHHRRGARRAR